MRWWFCASNHEVKIVVLAKLDRGNGCILLEKWEEEEEGLQGRQAEPVCRQHIAITRDENTNPVSYNVTSGGALVLGFRLLFLRDPSPLEGDIVIDVQDLREYAEQVWSQVRWTRLGRNTTPSLPSYRKPCNKSSTFLLSSRPASNPPTSTILSSSPSSCLARFPLL